MKTLFPEELTKFKQEVYKKMDEITSTNQMLQQHVTSVKRSNKDLIKKCEENEQYGRRLCLRIKSIHREEKGDLTYTFHVANFFIGSVVFNESSLNLPRVR